MAEVSEISCRYLQPRADIKGIKKDIPMENCPKFVFQNEAENQLFLLTFLIKFIWM